MILKKIDFYTKFRIGNDTPFPIIFRPDDTNENCIVNWGEKYNGK